MRNELEDVLWGVFMVIGLRFQETTEDVDLVTGSDS